MVLTRNGGMEGHGMWDRQLKNKASGHVCHQWGDKKDTNTTTYRAATTFLAGTHMQCTFFSSPTTAPALNMQMTADTSAVALTTANLTSLGSFSCPFQSVEGLGVSCNSALWVWIREQSGTLTWKSHITNMQLYRWGRVVNKRMSDYRTKTSYLLPGRMTHWHMRSVALEFLEITKEFVQFIQRLCYQGYQSHRCMHTISGQISQ